MMKLQLVLLATLFVSAVYSHGHMRCIDGTFDPKTRVITSCRAGIRNEALELGTPIENYKFNREPNAPMCQTTARGVANLEARYYSVDGTGGKAKLGQFEPGEKFTVIWYARNHAIATEQPRDIQIYMSPRPIQPGQTDDFTLNEMLTNRICQGPYVNCGAGLYNWAPDKNNVSCTMECAVPTTLPGGGAILPGIYTILWKWDWPAPVRIQHTCGDIRVNVVAGKTYTARDLKGVTGACGDSNYCQNVCGIQNITKCECNKADGWIDKVCINDSALGSAFAHLPLYSLLAFLVAALFA